MDNKANQKPEPNPLLSFENIQKQYKQCEKWKAKLIKNSPLISFMMEQLDKAGCPLSPDHFRCTPCDLSKSGGFAPEFGIILCQNRFLSKQHMEDTMTHELIHAFDHCTTHINWSNLKHAACSEIRATALSGDCGLTRELRRGIFGFGKHFQTCVKRRAVVGMLSHPKVNGDKGKAEDAVNGVWEECFNDTSPFDEIY